MALKIRVMPTLLYKDVGLVKGKGFDSWRRTGSVMQTVKVYNMREVDEMVFLDITATSQNREPDFEFIDEIADECFMPLTVGGGIRSVEDVRRLLMVGADKISLNTAAVENPQLITEVARRFGSQCVVVSIDFRKHPDGSYETFTGAGRKSAGLDPVEWAREAERREAGEILLTSIERDGTMTGYDVELTRRVSEAVSIPVIASGGCGEYEHMAEVLSEGKASAVAASAIYHFTQQTPLEAKKYLRERGFAVRI
ncbi:MAG: glycosyl amidation-associated protein WbuZ [candidate division Zixibacteria bacterium]|nr:glycosyl amidation-associated protein WbuZ [candidate division Zixibacteria bacterium]